MPSKNAPKFEAIALIATMRSGSNLLERLLSQHPKIVALGELFNPNFIGTRNSLEYNNFTIAERNENPEVFLSSILDLHPGKLPIFRYFHDHEANLLDPIVENPRIAKLFLRREPIESFVSVELARKTDQWILGRREKGTKAETFEFNIERYKKWEKDTTSFYETIREKTYLHQQDLHSIHYQDIKNLDELNAILNFLELEKKFSYFFEPIPKQNRKPLEKYLSNPAALEGLKLPPKPEPKPETQNWNTPLSEGYFSRDLRLIYVPIRGTGGMNEISALKKASKSALEAVSIDEILKLIEADPNILVYTRVIHPRLRLYLLMLENILKHEDDFDRDFREIAERLVSPGYKNVPKDVTRAGFAKIGLRPRDLRRLLREFAIFIRLQLWSGRRNELLSDLYWPQYLLVKSFERIAPIRTVVGENYPDELRFQPLQDYAPIADPMLIFPTDAKDLLEGFADQQVYDLYREDFEQYLFEINPKRRFEY